MIIKITDLPGKYFIQSSAYVLISTDVKGITYNTRKTFVKACATQDNILFGIGYKILRYLDSKGINEFCYDASGVRDVMKADEIIAYSDIPEFSEEITITFTL